MDKFIRVATVLNILIACKLLGHCDCVMQLKELKVVVREVKEVKVGQERTESQGIYSEALHRLIAVSDKSGIHRILTSCS